MNVVRVVYTSLFAAGCGFGWLINKKYHKGKVEREKFVQDIENYANGG